MGLLNFADSSSKIAKTPTHFKIGSKRFGQCFDNEYIVTSLDISNRLWIFELGFHPQKFNFLYQKYSFWKKLNAAEVKILNRNKADLNGTDSEEWNYKNIERLKTWHFLVFQLERKIRLVLIQKLIINLFQCERILNCMHFTFKWCSVYSLYPTV